MQTKTILNEVIDNDVIFTDLIFEDYGRVVVKDESCSIGFVNCIFEKTLDLKSIFEGIPESIFFDKCIFSSALYDRPIGVIINIDISKIKFYNCLVEELNIEECHVKNLNLYNTFTYFLSAQRGYIVDLFQIIFDFHRIVSMNINENSSYLDIFFLKQKAVYYNIYDGYVKFSFRMYELINKGSIEYKYFSSFNDNPSQCLNISLGITGANQNSINSEIEIKNATLRSLNLREKFNKIEIRNVKINVFGLENFQSNSAHFYQINHTDFNHSQIVKNYIKEKKAEIDEIINKIKSGTLSAEDKRRYESQKHENESKIKELKGRSIFNIAKSDLKNSSFWHIDFNGFERINFFNTNIEDGKFSMVKLSDTKFSSSENIYNDQWYNRDIDFKEEYDIYRQFANVFSKNGDIYNSLKAKSLQMKALLKFEDVDGKTKLILRINKITNDFGNSASRAFVAIFVAAVIFYCMFMGTMYSFSFTDKGWKYFVLHFKYIFSLILNPFSTTSKMDELVFVNNWTYAVVFASKIVMAFLYYQFVAAYRRFGKSEK